VSIKAQILRNVNLEGWRDKIVGRWSCRELCADAYAVKIHRTILHNPDDGCLYFGTSLLHDMDDQQKADRPWISLPKVFV